MRFLKLPRLNEIVTRHSHVLVVDAATAAAATAVMLVAVSLALRFGGGASPDLSNECSRTHCPSQS